MLEVKELGPGSDRLSDGESLLLHRRRWYLIAKEYDPPIDSI